MPPCELALFLCSQAASCNLADTEPLYAGVFPPITPDELLRHLASTLDLGEISLETLQRNLVFFAPGRRSSLCQPQLLELLCAFAAAATEQQQDAIDALNSMLMIKDKVDMAAQHAAGEPLVIRLVVQFPSRLMSPSFNSAPGSLPSSVTQQAAFHQPWSSCLGSQLGAIGAGIPDALRMPAHSLGPQFGDNSLLGILGRNYQNICGQQEQQQQQQQQQQTQQQTQKKARHRQAHDKSLGKHWTEMASELTDQVIPRMPLTQSFYQPSTIAKEHRERYENVLGSICKLVVATDSARGAGITEATARKHILDHFTSVNADVKRLHAYRPYQNYLDSRSLQP